MVTSAILRHSHRPAATAGFSLDAERIESILRYARPLGHHEDATNLNLGFGFVYYGLARALRPRHVLVVGSGFGFSVACFALALKDNALGHLSFVDPSYSVFADGPLKTIGGTAHWSDANKVSRHFARFGIEDVVTHYRMRSDEFFNAYARQALPGIDLAFIDGSHAFEDVKHDFQETLRRTRRNSYVLLHDTNIYIRELVRHAGVKRWLRMLKRRKDLFEIVDFPFASGVAIVRVLENEAWTSLESFRSSR
jgi:predicted O-methyltransferase YrrM